jgi:hypothetical protein
MELLVRSEQPDRAACKAKEGYRVPKESLDCRALVVRRVLVAKRALVA